jgi:hypothetical protein
MLTRTAFPQEPIFSRLEAYCDFDLPSEWDLNSLIWYAIGDMDDEVHYRIRQIISELWS